MVAFTIFMDVITKGSRKSWQKLGPYDFTAPQLFYVFFDVSSVIIKSMGDSGWKLVDTRNEEKEI